MGIAKQPGRDLGVVVGVLGLVACGSDPIGPGMSAVDGVRRGISEHVPMLGQRTVEMRMQTPVTEAGTESIYCQYLEPPEQDLWVSKFRTYQGPGGHHFVLFRGLKAMPAGTEFDCSSGESMKELMSLLTPIETRPGRIGAVDFPEGMALKIAAGTVLVAQSHYVNTSEDAIAYEDVMHLELVAEDEIADITPVYTYASTTLDIAVPPGGTDYAAAFDCELPYPLTFISALPHMHEHGFQFVAQVGPRTELETIIEVPKWTPEMRDRPAVVDFFTDAAPSTGQYAAGDVIRTFCKWRNMGEGTVSFPEEMCATSGYFFTREPEASALVCVGQDKVDPALMPEMSEDPSELEI